MGADENRTQNNESEIGKRNLGFSSKLFIIKIFPADSFVSRNFSEEFHGGLGPFDFLLK